MSNSPGNRYCWSVLAGALAGAGPVGALEPSEILVYHTGPVVIRPQFTLAERYDDNVLYSSSASAVADLVTTISPGLTFDIGQREKVNLTLDYVFDQSLYLDRHDLNSGNHTVSLDSRIRFTRFKVEGKDKFQFLSDVMGEWYGLGSTVDRFLYFDNWRVEYAVSEKTGIYLGGQYDAADYAKGTPLYDYNTLRATVGFGYKPFVKTTFFGELYYGQSAVTPNFDAVKGPYLSFFGGFVGARGQFTSKLGGTVKAGYENREFSDGSLGASSPVVDVSLDYKISEKRTASLSYSRSSGVSVQAVSQSYTADVVNMRLNQLVGSQGRLAFYLSGAVAFYGYESANVGSVRDDLLYRLDLGCTYKLRKWCEAGLGFQHEHFDSTLQGIVDYDVNRITLKVSVGY